MAHNAPTPALDGARPIVAQVHKGGPNGPSIMVSGSFDSVFKLYKAFGEGLHIPTEYEQDGETAGLMAFDYQIDKGTFPTKEESVALDLHDAQNVIMTSGDFRAQMEATIEEFGSFRFSVTPSIRANDFDVDSALSALRDASHALQFRRIFEIGLITRRDNNHISKIDLIPSFPGVEATNTPRRRKQKDVVKKEEDAGEDADEKKQAPQERLHLADTQDAAEEHVVYDEEKVVVKKEEG
ncbi:unnamed protein product [Zymoseptoria tritici ST99CH_3D7]|uniref:Uncharacterized protein n=1 Tax=Zymoseptoria tritici (strain ST99CH_3D7) TaxID=1276538 RepID=A0A1X7S6C2_ZYMT9|nr:unnamed protein product [Zymoseptoria tritici ST99CH_3D7]